MVCMNCLWFKGEAAKRSWVAVHNVESWRLSAQVWRHEPTKSRFSQCERGQKRREDGRFQAMRRGLRGEHGPWYV